MSREKLNLARVQFIKGVFDKGIGESGDVQAGNFCPGLYPFVLIFGDFEILHSVLYPIKIHYPQKVQIIFVSFLDISDMIRVMDLTNNYRALILNGLRRSGVSKTALAETMGYGKAWVTKLLNGTLKSVSDKDADKIEGLIGIRFVRFVDAETKVSSLAISIDRAIERNEKLGDVLTALLAMEKEAQTFTPRYFETQEMTKLGQEIIRVAFANDDKPGKVARELLKLVSE